MQRAFLTRFLCGDLMAVDDVPCKVGRSLFPTRINAVTELRKGAFADGSRTDVIMTYEPGKNTTNRVGLCAIDRAMPSSLRIMKDTMAPVMMWERALPIPDERTLP